MPETLDAFEMKWVTFELSKVGLTNGINFKTDMSVHEYTHAIVMRVWKETYMSTLMSVSFQTLITLLLKFKLSLDGRQKIRPCVKFFEHGKLWLEKLIKIVAEHFVVFFILCKWLNVKYVQRSIFGLSILNL